MKTNSLQSGEPPALEEGHASLLKVAAVREAADAMLAGVEDLHSPPAIAQRVLDITRRVDFDIRELTETVTADPAISAKVLRLVNSASYGLPREVTSVHQAVTIVGQRTLRLVVLTFSIVEKLTKGLGDRMYAAYWRTSLTTAVVAAKLSRSLRGVQPDEAYSAGLLCDLGALAFAQLAPDDYPELYATHAHDEALLRLEREAFGCSHADLGARLLERWGLARECCSAVLYHHELLASPSPMELATAAAAMTAKMLWRPNPEHVAKTRSLLRSELNCDTDRLIDLIMHCKEEVMRQAELYGVPRSEDFDARTLVEQARRVFAAASMETAMDFDDAMRMMEQPPPRRR